MTKLDIPAIQSRIAELAKLIDAPPNTLPTFGYSEESGRPEIRVNEQGYHFLASERGHEIEHLVFTDVDDLLYRIFAGITFSLAIEYELAHRIEGQDCRRIMFRYQVELLSRLSPEWARCEEQEHQKILEQYPFHDEAEAES